MQTIDLRSDTVTKPTRAMRQAMFDAEVGDDVFNEDPTVLRLQDEVATLLGKEAGLFVPSGVMGNQLALKIHTHAGDEVILERSCHIYNYESGAPGLLSGVQLNVVDGSRGILTAAQVKAAIRPGHYWEPQPRLVCLENTVNKPGGVVYPMQNILAIEAVVRESGLAYHLDGARIWNASAATGIKEATYAAPFDTVSVCLSKGLGAPVGSVLAGSHALIEAAHRYRKLFGGGMRQVGMLAAAGLYALEHHRPHLVDDHEKAKHLALALANLPAFDLDPDLVETNIVIFDVRAGNAAPVLATLAEEGVLMVPFGPATIRATTHRDLSMADLDAAIRILRRRFSSSVVLP